ncbi:MAG: glutaredoxin [Methanobacteriota archaeon]|nr:MAG: glutaredoxin [Euryarchaeota archaeon]
MGRVVSDAAASDADFVVYSTTVCPYCVAVKRLLDSKNLTYDEINFDHDPGARYEVVAETGHRTVPVVIDNRGENPMYIGGFNETQRYLK